MAEYDIVCKWLFKTYPQDFIWLTLNRSDFQMIEVLGKELPGIQPIVEARYTDALALIRIDELEVLSHLEFQTTDSRKTPMPQRMVGYFGRLFEEYGLLIDQTVIYLDADAGLDDSGEVACCFRDLNHPFPYQVIRLASLDGEENIRRNRVGLLPFVPLMRSPEDMPAENWLGYCIEQVLALEDPETRSNILTCLAILSQRRYQPPTITHFIEEELMFETEIGRILAKRGYQKGILEGRKEGMLEGQKEGHLEEKQASIKKLLEIRFGKLSPSVEDQIEATTDLGELDRLFMQAATAKSLQEIRFNN